MNNHKFKINFKQPKYMIPALVYLPIIFTSYMLFDMFNFEPEEDNGMETTEYLNNKLPEAQIKGDGVGGKYQSMLDSYGKIQDESAVLVAGDDSLSKEEYESKYSDAEIASMEANSPEQIAALEKLKKLSEQLQASDSLSRTDVNKGQLAESFPTSEEYEAEAQEELEQIRESVEKKSQKQIEEAEIDNTGVLVPKIPVEEPVEEPNPDAVSEIAEDAPVEQVVKKQKETSDYFNTISSKDDKQKLIKAIIDEDIKAVDGSRVRLRLLDELEVGERILPTGSYLYARMSGFGSQRVKGNVTSVLIDEELVKINLSIYDTDGLEGLYVPESNFRETTKDVASSALSSGGGNFFSGSASNNLAQMGYTALQNGYSRITNAASKAIRKNKAKLKYGTFVYLINSKDNNNKQNKNQKQ